MASPVYSRKPSHRPKTVPLNTKCYEDASPKDEKARMRSRRSEDAQNPHFIATLEQHRDRIRTAVAKVDTRSPIVDKTKFASPNNFNSALNRFVNIERQNATLMANIAQIMQGQGKVESRLKPVTKSIDYRGHNRQVSMLRITFDNLALLKRIQEVRPIYSTADLLKDYERNEKEMEYMSYYPLFWKVDDTTKMGCSPPAPKPLVYLEIHTENGPLGKVMIELRADIVPLAAENFRCLCTGEKGLTYRCTAISRVVPDIYWQGGTIAGGKSIYGDYYKTENYKLKHTSEGIVSMINLGPNMNGSQFVITARPLPALDGVNVVVGKVIAGMEILTGLYDLVTPSGLMKQSVWIGRCGEVGDEDDIEFAGESDYAGGYNNGPSEEEGTDNYIATSTADEENTQDEQPEEDSET